MLRHGGFLDCITGERACRDKQPLIGSADHGPTKVANRPSPHTFFVAFALKYNMVAQYILQLDDALAIYAAIA